VKSSAGSAFAAALESDHNPTKPMKEARFGGLTHAERLGLSGRAVLGSNQ